MTLNAYMSIAYIPPMFESKSNILYPVLSTTYLFRSISKLRSMTKSGTLSSGRLGSYMILKTEELSNSVMSSRSNSSS